MSIVGKVFVRPKKVEVKQQELAINASCRPTLYSILKGESSISDLWELILEKEGLEGTYLSTLQCSRMYFGNEFCQMLMPNLDEIEKMIKVLEGQNVNFTLLTSYLTDLGLSILDPLLQFLDSHGREHNKKYEVVVNDWGALRVIKLKYSSLVPVLGRLMLKMNKDPRVALKADESSKAFGFSTLQQCSLTVPVYLEFLRTQNVKRVELDFVEQGFAMDFSSWNIEASLHFPIKYITTARRCPMANLSREPEYKYGYYNTKCNRECQKYETQIIPRPGLILSGGTELFYVGNTVFSIPPWKDEISSLKYLTKIGINRIIFTPRIPI